ncbi:hypothetical protein JHK85_007051 [Glycine max]|nr:hypothetical protein JHK85_007051 [Glycine max]KAG5071640.1 hypothetical protein JHK86_006851 [Glycine max]
MVSLSATTLNDYIIKCHVIKNLHHQIAREVLDAAAPIIQSSVTTDEIDRVVHAATITAEATPSVTFENVVKEHKFAATHTHSLKSVVEKTITLGKLEGCSNNSKDARGRAQYSGCRSCLCP